MKIRRWWFNHPWFQFLSNLRRIRFLSLSLFLFSFPRVNWNWSLSPFYSLNVSLSRHTHNWVYNWPVWPDALVFYYYLRIDENNRRAEAESISPQPHKIMVSLLGLFFRAGLLSRFGHCQCVYICVEKYNANNVCWCVCVCRFTPIWKLFWFFTSTPLQWMKMDFYVCVCVLLWDRSPLGHSLPLSDFVVSSLFFFLVYTHHHISLALFYLPKAYTHTVRYSLALISECILVLSMSARRRQNHFFKPQPSF